MLLPRYRHLAQRACRSVEQINTTRCYSSFRSFPKRPVSGLSNQSAQLESRFPIKTTIFLAATSAAVYYAWNKVTLEILNNRPDFLQTYLDPLDVNEHLAHVDEFAPVIPIEGDRADEILHFCERDIEEGPGKNRIGLPTVHLSNFGSNQPCEDELLVGVAPGPGGEEKWCFWGVFDGHAGWATSQYLKHNILPYLSRALSSLPANATSLPISNAIKTAFLRLDSDIMSNAMHTALKAPPLSADAIAALGPAISGSCALVAIFEPKTSKLRVACTGDSRAVLGRWSPLEQKYIARAMSEDQTGFNQSEVERIKRQHPDEEEILNPETGRLLGLAVTRAFGDARWKWPESFLNQIKDKFFTGQAVRPHAKTQPYLTAEPEIKEIVVERGDEGTANAGHPDFLIMASDGLWDRISSEHAVECVNLWLDSKIRGKGKVAADPANARYKTTAPDDGFDYEEGKEIFWHAEPKYFVVEDENAATHLVKNAFGGSRRRLFHAVMTIYPPFFRSIRDDITVQVIFFNRAQEDRKAKKEKK